MNEQEAKIHRTWIQMLVDHRSKEAAAIGIDTDIALRYERWKTHYTEDDGTQFNADTLTVQFHVPTAAYNYVKNDTAIRESLEQPMRTILEGRILPYDAWDSFNNTYEQQEFTVQFLELELYVKLIDIEEGWKDKIRELIANSSGIRNQGTATEFKFKQENKAVITYNGLKFASQSELRIAQELERHKVLFFPLAVGVRAETGQLYKDHREVDFLVCHNGVWGILEVSGPSHEGRLAKDVEKDLWFKQSGILCIEHRTAEQCFDYPKRVTQEFLRLLEQHKR